MALGTLNEKAPLVEQQMAVLLSQTGSHEDQMSSVRQASRRPSRSSRASVAALLPGSPTGCPGSRARSKPRSASTTSSRRRFDEKTQQGRREAEDIRSQIAPLLEERVRRHESDALLFSEMERLRESLAESLHDLAERLRHASGSVNSSGSLGEALLELASRQPVARLPRSRDRNRSSLRQSGCTRTVSSR